MLVLIGHLGGTAVIFSVLLVVAWLPSWVIHLLDSLLPFHPHVLEAAQKVELVLFYLDAGLCGTFLIVGLWRFIKEIAV